MGGACSPECECDKSDGVKRAAGIALFKLQMNDIRWFNHKLI